MQQFFKNAAEAWASSPHLRSKSNCTMKLQQKSKRKSEELQLPSKSEGCNERTRFQGQLRFPGKLGMCPSLAEPDSGGFPRSNFEMFHVKHFVATVPPEQLQNTCFPFRFHKAGRSCSPPRKAFAFLTTPSVCQKHGTGISLPAGSDQGYSP